MKVLSNEIMRQVFRDDFLNINPAYFYTYIGNYNLFDNFMSCARIRNGSYSSEEYVYFSPLNTGVISNTHYICDYKNSIMKCVFGSMNTIREKVFPEFGFFNEDDKNSNYKSLLVSVDPSDYKFCIRQNKTIIAKTDLEYNIQRTYIGILIIPDTAGTKANLVIGEYNSTNNFSNCLHRIVNATITAPSDLYLPVFGCKNYDNISSELGYYLFDYFEFSVERKPLILT